MNEPILFYFDFTSPYSYLASEKIDALAERFGRQVHWHPILLGAVLKTLGGLPLLEQPGKADYSTRDFARSARFLGVPYSHPVNFPASTVACSRAYYVLAEQDAALARRFAHEVFRAYFTRGENIADTAVVLALCSRVGASAVEVEKNMSHPAIKDRLRAETDAALAAGVFGAPWIVVDGEPFWGADRLPQIERWLENGAF